MHKRTASAIEFKHIDHANLNPKDKKIVEQFPQMTKEDLEKLKRNSNGSVTAVSRNVETINKSNYMTAKTTLLSSLHSNIFNDPV